MFTSEDVKKYKAFKRVIFSGEYSIKGDAGSIVGVLFKWFDELEFKIEKLSKEEGKLLSVKITEAPLPSKKKNKIGK